MDFIKLVLFIFLLTAFTIGINFQDASVDPAIVDNLIDNVTLTVQNINFSSSYNETLFGKTNLNGVLISLEYYIKFVGIFVLEMARSGIHFGYENPQYFEPSFVVKIIKLIILLIIISLLIKPLFYVTIFIVMLVMWLYKKFKKKNEKIHNKRSN